jgi:prepilin-type N-terminal cleavage/methylation domain-containing protein
MFLEFHQPLRLTTLNRVATRSGRTGFTLMELMLVLSILVVIGSMAVPSLNNMMERQRIRSAADEMRLVWDSARIKAMRTGQAQIFKCQVGTNGYSIEPLILHDDVNNVGEGATVLNGGVAVQTTSSTYGMTTSLATTSDLAQKLDESLSFTSCVVAGDIRAYSIAQSGQSNAVSVQSVNQSVIFYPDGSTSTAELKFKNERGDSIGIQIRGLTGHTKLLPFEGAGEVSP